MAAKECGVGVIMSKVIEPPRIIILAEADPTVHRIFPDLAKDIGLDESIFLMQIAFWLKTGGEFIDGRWWTYQSVRDMEEKAFKYWSISTINRIAKRLIDAGYLLEANYNKKKYDRTRWFALNVDKLQELESITIMIGDKKLVHSEPRKNHHDTQSAQDATRQNQNETTIPESLTESLTEIKEKDSSSLPEEAAPIIADADSDSHNPVQSPEAARVEEAAIIEAVEEIAAVVIPAVEESASQLPEGSPVEELSEEVAPVLETEQLDPDPIAPEELEAIENSEAVRQAEAHLVKETTKNPLNDLRKRVFAGVSLLCFDIDANSDEPKIKALLASKSTQKRIGKITSWLMKQNDPEIPEKLWAFSKWYERKFGGIDMPRDDSKFAEHFTKFLQNPVSATDNSGFSNHRRPTEADYKAPDTPLPSDALARLQAMANSGVKVKP